MNMTHAETQSMRDIIDAKKTAKHRLDDIRTAIEGDILSDFDDIVFNSIVSMIKVLSPKEL
jgi:predicted transcriptional regulator